MFLQRESLEDARLDGECNPEGVAGMENDAEGDGVDDIVADEVPEIVGDGLLTSMAMVTSLGKAFE